MTGTLTKKQKFLLLLAVSGFHKTRYIIQSCEILLPRCNTTCRNYQLFI